jgi:hypothetical protein
VTQSIIENEVEHPFRVEQPPLALDAQWFHLSEIHHE